MLDSATGVRLHVLAAAVMAAWMCWLGPWVPSQAAASPVEDQERD